MNKAMGLLNDLRRRKVARLKRTDDQELLEQHHASMICENCDKPGAKWRAEVFKGQQEEICVCDACHAEIQSLFSE